jgi:hypothetical protein
LPILDASAAVIKSSYHHILITSRLSSCNYLIKIPFLLSI